MPPARPLSVRFQALVVYECLSEWGQILCAICPNPRLVITGGTSTAICVWETGTSKERAKSLALKQVNTQTRTHGQTYSDGFKIKHSIPKISEMT